MVTTHFMDEAEYCDRVALIYRGQCIAIDTPETLQTRVATKELPHPTLEDAFIGLVEARDPKFVATVETIGHVLGRNGYLFRYEAPDDFGAPTTAFTICSFWYVEALAAIGRRDEARDLFEKILARRNHVGLLSEDIDPVTGELWGNFPQTYSAVGIILCAMRLSKSWEEAR